MFVISGKPSLLYDSCLVLGEFSSKISFPQFTHDIGFLVIADKLQEIKLDHDLGVDKKNTTFLHLCIAFGSGGSAP